MAVRLGASSLLLMCAMAAAAVLGSQTPAGLAQGQGDAAQIRELAERMLAGPTGIGGPGTQPFTAELLPGRIPPDLNLDLPVPPGGRLVGSLARRAGERLINAQMLYDASGSPLGLAEFYRADLAARGWSASPQGFAGSPGGFQPGPPSGAPEFSLFCQSEEGPMLTVVTGPRPNGLSEARLSAQFAFPVPFGPAGFPAGGPCSVRQPGPIRPPIPNPLPRLSGPPGVQLVPTGGSGGPNLLGSEALAMTDKSAAELAEHFGAQLAEAGWVNVAAGSEAELAWSLWDVPGEPAGQGLLTALQSPEDDRIALSLRLYAAGSPFGPVPGQVTVVAPFVSP